jgi:hypothetical protein
MPVPKSRTKHVDLLKQVAGLLLIPESIVFLDVGTSKRSTVRIWTEGMDYNEKARIRAKKDEIKDLASKINAKVAMSDRHPLGEDGQIEFEKRRRKARSSAQKSRNVAATDE